MRQGNSPERKLENLCKEYYAERQHFPTKNEDEFKGYNMYCLIKSIREGKYSSMPNLKDKVKAIFGTLVGNTAIDDKMKLCREYYSEHHHFPKSDVMYKGRSMRNLIRTLMDGKDNKYKDELRNMFPEYATKLKMYERIEKCRAYKAEYNKFPTPGTVYEEFDIYCFVKHHLRCGKGPTKKELLEIFEIKEEDILDVLSIRRHKMNLCAEFYNINHRLPGHDEIYGGFNLYNFANNIQICGPEKLKEELNDIFEGKLDALEPVNKQHIRIERIKLCKEFYDIHHRIPKVDEIYKGVAIGSFVKRICVRKAGPITKCSYARPTWVELSNIFGRYNMSNKIYEDKLKLCEEFYFKFKRIPKTYESFGNFNIGNFIFRIRRNESHPLYRTLRNIFGELFEINKRKSNRSKDNRSSEKSQLKLKLKLMKSRRSKLFG